MRDFGHERDHRIRIFSDGLIPGYSDLKDFGWIDQYRKKLTAESELQRLRGILAELRGLTQTREEFFESCIASLDCYHERRIANLSRFLAEAARKRSRDPFGRLEKLSAMVAPDPPTGSDIEAALDLLPADLFATVDESTRSGEEAKIRGEIDRIELEIASCTPPPFLKLDRDGIVRDVRATFLEFWIGRQEQCSEGINAAGFPIVSCPDAERNAYSVFEIAKHINPKGMLPASRE